MYAGVAQAQAYSLTMSVEILDGATIRDFVGDEKAFNISVRALFATLDANGDGILSFKEISSELMSLRVLETHFGIDGEGPGRDELVRLYATLFRKFDRDGNGAVDLEEFKEEMKEMMLAVADGIGIVPVQMVLEEGSLLKKAVEREKMKTIFT